MLFLLYLSVFYEKNRFLAYISTCVLLCWVPDEYFSTNTFNVARKHEHPSVAMLWNLVKMIYKSTPQKKQPVNNLLTQTSNQSSSEQSAITRGGSFGTAGIAMLNGSNGNVTVNHVGSGENISSNEEVLNDSNEIGSITVPKVPIPDIEVEIFDDSLVQNGLDCRNLRDGFLYTGPHDNFVKDFPMCSSSLINHELMHSHYRNHRTEMERKIVETSPPPEQSFLQGKLSDIWRSFKVRCL